LIALWSHIFPDNPLPRRKPRGKKMEFKGKSAFSRGKKQKNKFINFINPVNNNEKMI